MTALRGHEAQTAAFVEAMRGGRLHHAWLLAGPKGVGKGGFARAAAARLLAEAAGPPPAGEGLAVPADHPTARLIAADAHPDFRVIERLVREGRGEELARNISIDQIRALIPMLGMAPALSTRRVIVIDAVDDLERAGANALLKSLEEPPAGTIFLLVSHSPGRLLPTIRSRCRILRFQSLGDDVMAAALADALPEATADELAALVRAGGGAPGQALRFAGLDLAGLDAALARIADTGDAGNAERLALAKALSAKSVQPRYQAFLERAPAFLVDRARTARGAQLAAILGEWERARDLAASALPLSLDPQATVFQLCGHVAALARTRAHAKG